MIELKMQFKSLEDLGEFLKNAKGIESKSTVEVKPSPAPVAAPVVEAAPVKEKKKKYSKEELIEMTDAEADELLSPAQKGQRTKALNDSHPAPAAAPVQNTAASVFAQPAPIAAQPVQEAASVVPPAAPQPAVIDRDSYIAKAQDLIGQLKNLGVADAEVMPKLQEAYMNAGVPWQRVSELGDQYLPIVVGEIEKVVYNLSQAGAQGSYI